MRAHLAAALIFLLFTPSCAVQPPLVAVIDLTPRHEVDSNQAAVLSDRLRTEIFRLGQVRLLERERMEAILIEQGFQQAGCTTQDCAVETGRLLGVQKLIVGSVSRMGITWTVNARLLSVETGEILQVAVVDHRGPIDGLLAPGMKKIADQLKGLPLGPIATADSRFAADTNPAVQPIGETASDTVAGSGPPEPVRRHGFQFGLVWPLQVVPASDGVEGPAIHVVHGRNAAVRGMQVAGFWAQVDGLLEGPQIAGAVVTAGRAHGPQVAGLVCAARDVRSVQIAGTLNLARSLHGAQVSGFLNVAHDVAGIQVGFVNVARRLKGVQIGLVNIAGSGGLLPVMPFLNVGF